MTVRLSDSSDRVYLSLASKKGARIHMMAPGCRLIPKARSNAYAQSEEDGSAIPKSNSLKAVRDANGPVS